MTIKELKKKIEKLPDHMDVFIDLQERDEFRYAPVEKAKVKTISFMEYEGGPVLAKDKCFVLTDDI